MNDHRPAIAETMSGTRSCLSIVIGPHALTADESIERGGDDRGPQPFEWLAAALAACTSLTIKRHAEADELPLRRVHVEVTVTHEGTRTSFEKLLRLDGALDDAQTERLVAASQRSRVHQTLMGAITISTRVI